MTGRADRAAVRGRAPGNAARRGFTLLELLIAVTLLSLLTAGFFMALRIGLNAMERASNRFTESRRVVGVQRILRRQIAGIVPALVQCGGGQRGVVFFDGKPNYFRVISTHSLAEADRGYPRILEYMIIPGERAGVRFVVNELPYAGPSSIQPLCAGAHPFRLLLSPPRPSPASFVLGDNLASARFLYLRQDSRTRAREWVDSWEPIGDLRMSLPEAIRVEMTPLNPDPSRLQLASATLPVRVNRSPLVFYDDIEQEQVLAQQ
jgi:general secretion pathway protein J